MNLRGYLLIFTTSSILVFTESEPRVPHRSARSAPATITRRNKASSSVSEYEESLDLLIETLQSLKSEQEEMSLSSGLHSGLFPSQNKKSSRTGTSSRADTSSNINTYLDMFSSLYSIYEPVLVDHFLQNFPQDLVCVLADKTQCGWQADLTATLTSRLSEPVLSLLSSLKSQMCSFTSSGSVRTADPTLVQLKAFQELVTAALSSSLPFYLSDNVLSAWNNFSDLFLPSVVSFISDFMINFLQTFMEFLTVGLQIGLDIPSLNQTHQCQQGDLKQLLMWGMKHNISWSFGDSVLNMFLALDNRQCSFTDRDCQYVQTDQLGRSSTPSSSYPTAQLTCDQQDVSHLNDTLCADILANASQTLDALYGVCKALSTLSHSELIHVWKNSCKMVQLVISPFLESCPLLSSESSRRVARSTLSIKELLCNYENWTTVDAIDPGLVTVCSDNDPEAFLQGVCNNVAVMQTLIANPSNVWVWEYCANASERYMVKQFCVYDTWTPLTLDPSIVALCWNNDQVKMESLLCQNLDFYMIVLSSKDNSWITPNCAETPTSPPITLATLVAQSCRYSQWKNVKAITLDQISLCIQNDEIQFVSEICTNSTFLDALLLNPVNAWVGEYCAISIKNPPTSPPVVSVNSLSPALPLTSSFLGSNIASSDMPPPTTLSSLSKNTLFPSKTSIDLLSETSTVYLSSRTSSSLPTILSSFSNIASSITPAPTTQSISNYTLFPTNTAVHLPETVPSILSSISSFSLSPTSSLILSSPASSVVSISPTKVLSVASSITLFPSTPSTVTSTNSILRLSSSYPFFITSSMTLSVKFSATVSNFTLAPVNSLLVLPTISSTAFSAVLPTTVSSITVSPTTSPTVQPAVPSISDLCKYASWGVSPLDPLVVGLCWQLDMAAFHQNVCCNMALFDFLTLDLKNHWLKSVCSNNNTTDFLSQVCLYADWSQPTIVDMTDLALCADLDTLNFTKKVCNNTTVLKNLLANLDNTWLLEQCSNLTRSSSGGASEGKGKLMGFVPSDECQYSNWAIVLPDAALLVLCWDYDQANFISSVCMKPAILSYILREPSSIWVSTLCTNYSNYTKATTQFNSTNNGSYNNTNATNNTNPCLLKELIHKLNWSCSVDISAACQAGINQFQGLQAFFRCGVEVLLPRMQKTMNPEVASMVRQSTSVWVVLLLILEENMMTTLRVTDNILQNVLDSVSAFLERETRFENKQVLLQCFGKVLTSLMQTGRDVSSTGSFLIKEYFHIPLARLRTVLNSTDISTMRQIVQYFNRNQAKLQLSDEYLGAMVNVLTQVHLRQDESLFFDMRPLLSLATPEDIILLPPLQNNVNIINYINSIINSLSLEQRQAFGWWLSQYFVKVNITGSGLSFIRDKGNLIAYLPFSSFQYLSPAQLLDGLDVLLRNNLGSLKQQFMAQSIIGGYKNLTADQFRRLGTLTCLASLNDLLAYINTDVFPVIQENIRTCVTQGISVPSAMISSLFFNSSDVQNPSSLSPQRISQLAQFLPLMGVDFLQQLSQVQLLPLLSLLTSVPFTPLQAAVIIDKVSSGLNLSEPESGAVSQLRFLASGVSVESLWGLPSDSLLRALSNFSQFTPQLTPAQLNAISKKLWAVPAVVTWLNEVEPLLSSTPLLCVQAHARRLLTVGSAPYTRTWNTQQAKTLFSEAMTSIKHLSTQQFTSLGTVAQGMSCQVLTLLIKSSPTASSMRDILKVLREQPMPLHPSLKNCVIEELSKFAFFSNLLQDMGAEIALSIPMSTIKRFPVRMMDILRSMIVQEPQYFLLIPSNKQTILVDKIVQRLGMYTGTYTEEEFRSLGIMASFVIDEVFVQLDRNFFLNSLEFLRGFCYDSSKRDIVASILLEPRIFGPVRNWTSTTLNQVGRFLFYLPGETIRLIPPDLMSQERIEQLIDSQQQWESGDVGSRCVQERTMLFTKQQIVLQYFLGFLNSGRTVSPVPTCESLHVMQPSVWPINSLTEMSSTSFRRCLELIGQDPFFSIFQLSLLLRKTKQVFGAVSYLNPYITAELGNIATQLSADELASLKLSDIRTISPLGAVSKWTKKQLGVLFSAVLNATKQTPSQLDSSTFVALGYIICGIDVAVIRSLSPVEFSKAVLSLGHLNLSCTEDQLQAMVTLLSNSLAFGPISSWGPEVFIEIGVFAAGIPDMAMSALVREQIEGISPLAISLIPAKKFVVVFNQAQISLFSYEQAIAVTAAQRSALSSLQETALSMVLNPWEDKPVDFRGRSFGIATHVCPIRHLCCLLLLILTLLCPLF